MKTVRSVLASGILLPLLVGGCDFDPQKRADQTNKPIVKTWSGVAGDPDFSSADRMAIENVMDAYSVYWDSGDIERFFGLFTDDAVKITGSEETESVTPFQPQKQAAIKRTGNIRSLGLQRRHLMSNTHFLEQSESTAHIQQYALITSTEAGITLKPVATVVYDVWLQKVDGVWKIAKYRSTEDSALDLKL